MKHPTVYTTAPATGVSATVRWDEESSTLFCEVNYSPLPSPREPQSSLSDLLDVRFGIGTPSYVLTAGTLSMLLDQHRRLTRLDFYTNPERWTVRMSEPLTDPTDRTPHIETEFDEHGHADDMEPPVIVYEPRDGTLYLSWGPVSHWYGIAPALAIGVADDKRLTQIRLHGLTIPPRSSKSAPIE
ncbi:hypothetical protein OKW38_003272 [Paraburkholderia sp. MM5496-R1]|uniref:Uncharacterized protein n=1 Tax=Paraburkholderia tuberum TaxID=157910 RepID=A0A1H1EVY3_9BURK|nr:MULTISPECIES: hypothetical protein [Paraburkholderia]MBC8721816.1 hypothetical protein [Paraburkholderia sp. 31.1]SDQ92905.1 hypothetical protein SAMN05445850_2161 [Paraburkholderia tuberum]